MQLKANNSEYIISADESKRISFLKFTAMVLVVFWHSYNTSMAAAASNGTFTAPLWLEIFESIISHGITSVSLPLFFIMSAILLFKRSHTYKSLLVKKAKRLLIPYLFWNSFWILAFFILQKISFTQPYFSNPNNIIANFP